MLLTNYLIWSSTKKKNNNNKTKTAVISKDRGEREAMNLLREFEALYNGVFIMDFQGLL